MQGALREKRTVSATREGHTAPTGQRVHHPKSHIVATRFILRTGIAEAHHHPQRGAPLGGLAALLLTLFAFFRFLLPNHLRLARFLFRCSRDFLRRHPLDQHRNYGPGGVLKYPDVSPNGKLTDVNGVTKIEVTDIHLDVTGNRPRQTLDAHLAQMLLQNASLKLHADGFPHYSERDLNPDFSLHGDLEEIGVQRFPSHRISLQLLQNDSLRSLTIPLQGEGNQDILARPGPHELQHFKGIDRHRHRPGGTAIYNSRNHSLPPKLFRGSLANLRPDLPFQYRICHCALLLARHWWNLLLVHTYPIYPPHRQTKRRLTDSSL